MNINNLNTLLTHKLKMLYSIETQLVEAIPNMVAVATDTDLKRALETHLEQTKEQVTRLDTIATTNSLDLFGEQDKTIASMIEHGEEMIRNVTDTALRDVVVVGAADIVECYEISLYQHAILAAKQLDMKEVEELLEDSLDEEKHTQEKLIALAGGGSIIGQLKAVLT